jgi:hypothetical protein
VETNKLLSPNEVADVLGVSKQTLAVWRCEQRYPLPYVKVGSRVISRERSRNNDGELAISDLPSSDITQMTWHACVSQRDKAADQELLPSTG